MQEGLLRKFAGEGDAFHDVVMTALLRKECPPAQRFDRPAASVATQRAFLERSAGTTRRGAVRKPRSEPDPSANRRARMIISSRRPTAILPIWPASVALAVILR